LRYNQGISAKLWVLRILDHSPENAAQVTFCSDFGSIIVCPPVNNSYSTMNTKGRHNLKGVGSKVCFAPQPPSPQPPCSNHQLSWVNEGSMGDRGPAASQRRSPCRQRQDPAPRRKGLVLPSPILDIFYPFICLEGSSEEFWTFNGGFLEVCSFAVYSKSMAFFISAN